MIKPFFYYQQHQINKALLVGLGISGISVIKYLSAYTINIDIFDQKNKSNHYIVDYEVFDNINLEVYDLIVVAPGIPLNRSPFTWLSSYWHKVVGDIELFSAHITQKKQKVVAITGSNGKSTVASLLHHILSALCIRVALGGNIGIPALSIINDNVDIYVLEVSSFQIDLLKKAQFDVVSMLNLSPDHVDRYKDYMGYCDSKLALLARGKYVVMNAKHKEFTASVSHNNFNYFNTNNTYANCTTAIFEGEIFCEQSEVFLQGKHNLENIVSVLVMLQGLMTFSDNLIAIIKKAVMDFMPLAHRCSLVRKFAGIRFINDSKATNIASVEAAIIGLGSADKNIIILLGGIAKGANFCGLTPVLKRYVKKTFIYGRDRMFIYAAIANEVSCELCDNLDQAFSFGASLACGNDIVLLSPGCASFDDFLSYVHRGEQFETLVKKIR